MKKIALIAGVVLVALGGFALLSGGEPATDEERIRAVVDDLAGLAGKRDVSGMMDHVSERYRDRSGADRTEVKRYLAALLFRGEFNHVQITSTDVKVEGAQATAEVAAVLMRGERGDEARGLAVGAHRITFRLEREGGDWKIVASEHRPAEATELLGR